VKEVKKAVDLFNKYHSPEARAEIVELRGNTVVVKFEGAILFRSCCLYDYFEDLVYCSNLKMKIEDYEEREDGFYVRYRISTS
jgi:hypothetical protein